MIDVIKILVTIGSVSSVGFGVWHFFVPKLWNWYAYIDSSATELTIAVRAINVFFSLSLVLFGALNILMVYGGNANRYSVIVILTATCILWLTRTTFQIVYPQGTLYAGLQYGMLSAFSMISLCYVLSLFLVILSTHN